MRRNLESKSIAEVDGLLRLAKGISASPIGYDTRFEFLVKRYNEIADKLHDEIIPRVEAFDQATDTYEDDDYYGMTNKGIQKYSAIKLNCENYLNTKRPVLNERVVRRGMSPTVFWSIIGLVTSAAIAVSFGLYGVGRDNGRLESKLIWKDSTDALRASLHDEQARTELLRDSLMIVRKNCVSKTTKVAP